MARQVTITESRSFDHVYGASVPFSFIPRRLDTAP
jgi:hypothetical protein